MGFSLMNHPFGGHLWNPQGTFDDHSDMESSSLAPACQEDKKSRWLCEDTGKSTPGQQFRKNCGWVGYNRHWVCILYIVLDRLYSYIHIFIYSYIHIFIYIYMFIFSMYACTFCVLCDWPNINHCNFAVSDSFSSHISQHLLETHSSAF